MFPTNSPAYLQEGRVPWCATEFVAMLNLVNEQARSAPPGTADAIVAHLFFVRYPDKPMEGACHLDRFYKILSFVDQNTPALLEEGLAVRDARGRVGLADRLTRVLVSAPYDAVVPCRDKPHEDTFDLKWILERVNAAQVADGEERSSYGA